MAKRVEMADKEEFKRIAKNWQKTAFGKALHGIKGKQEDTRAFGRIQRQARARGIGTDDFYDKYGEGRQGKELVKWSKKVFKDETFSQLQPGETRFRNDPNFATGFDPDPKRGEARKKRKRTLLTGSQGLQSAAGVKRETLLGH